MCLGKAAAASSLVCYVVLVIFGGALSFAVGGYIVKWIATGAYDGTIPSFEPFSPDNFWTWNFEYSMIAFAFYSCFIVGLFICFCAGLMCDGLLKRFKKDYIYGPCQRRISGFLGCILCPCCNRKQQKYQKPVEMV